MEKIMGGLGSGRPAGFSSHATTEGYRALDVRYLKRERLLEPGASAWISWRRGQQIIRTIKVEGRDGEAILHYRARRPGGEWLDVRYPVKLLTTPAPLGGERVWFECPNSKCGRRVALLYAGDVFLCRHCRDLTYQSQREPTWGRLLRQAHRIRDKLDWEPGTVCYTRRDKPKGMHWTTYCRLAAQHDHLVANALGGLEDDLEQRRRKVWGSLP
jgi:hypothetical protein